jgi:hypothetical protein
MNVEIGAEAVLFPEKKYINGIFVAGWTQLAVSCTRCPSFLNIQLILACQSLPDKKI